MNGTIVRLLRDKGFGFIRVEGAKAEYFFHLTAVRSGFDSVNEGDAVTFDDETGPKGPRAGNVQAA